MPKETRERLGMKRETEVPLRAVKDLLIIQKKSAKLRLGKLKGRCKKSFAKLGYKSVDEFIEDARCR